MSTDRCKQQQQWHAIIQPQNFCSLRKRKFRTISQLDLKLLQGNHCVSTQTTRTIHPQNIIWPHIFVVV